MTDKMFTLIYTVALIGNIPTGDPDAQKAMQTPTIF